MNIENAINELVVMRDNLWEDLQAERKIVMEHNIYGREWERALRKYDELAIRMDQIKKVFDVIDKWTNNATD